MLKMQVERGKNETLKILNFYHSARVKFSNIYSLRMPSWLPSR